MALPRPVVPEGPAPDAMAPGEEEQGEAPETAAVPLDARKDIRDRVPLDSRPSLDVRPALDSRPALY